MSSRKSKKFCVEDAPTLLLDGNQSDVEELDSDDDDDDDEVRCDNSGLFIEEVDVNDKDDVDNDDVIDTDGIDTVKKMMMIMTVLLMMQQCLKQERLIFQV